MALNIDAIRKKMAIMAGDGNPGMFKPEEGENTVRVIPLKGKDDPFQELYFHYNLIPRKTFLSPMSFGEPDPVVEFKDMLLSGGRVSKEDFKEIMQRYNPSIRTYLQVIVRGREDEGIKFWAFGQKTLKDIWAIIADDEYGDITDPENGFDLKLTFTPKEKSETNFAETKVLAKRQPSPLSKNKEQAHKWLNEQPDLLTVLGYERMTYKQLQEVLDKVVNSARNSPSVTDVLSGQAAITESVATTTTKSSTGTAKVSADVSEEFSALFDAE